MSHLSSLDFWSPPLISVCTKEATWNTDSVRLKRELQSHDCKGTQSSSISDELQIKCNIVYQNSKQVISFVFISPSDSA